MSVEDEVLDGVGPRLRTRRQQRGLTLSELAATTGISVSTLSRLESGERRPTLEQLLVLSRVHAVPIDELIGSAPVEDPRVRSRAIKRNGMTMWPLTRRPGALQAYRAVIERRASVGQEQGSHEGYEWMYVLAGRVRLLLGDHDLVLTAGEVAEFDTRTPHWFGAVAEPAEVLMLFGPQGERMHVRARPARRSHPGSSRA